MSASPQRANPPAPPALIDGCGRVIDHLRLSLIDHCNLACRYCVDDNAVPQSHRIDADFAFAVVRWLVEHHGFCHVRLTGGEPLLYPELIPLIGRLTALRGLDEITLTTNAQALATQARPLRDAGLSRINISLDTLRPDRFAHLTRGGRLDHTLRGIEAALDVGLSPVRINAVVQRGTNDDELPDLAEWALSRGAVMRFLEAMPIGPLAHIADQHLVSAAVMLDRLSERFEMRPIPRPAGQPSTDYAARAGDLRGVIGVIASTTRPFCDTCRRLRVTARGRLMTCLYDPTGVPLIDAWDGQTLDTRRADDLMLPAVAAKLADGRRRQAGSMIQIGG